MKIGRYEIIKELGRGGMAVVYLARDPQFKRQVAIKVLPQQLTFDPQFRARFEREAEVIASLEHAAIVPVHDYGEDNGQPYLVMRYMPGGSLRDRIKKGPLGLQEAQQIIAHLAPALDKAHRRGVIHRDLKPENILFDDEGEPAISDFGIAKLAESSQALTGSGVIATPAYMSPEQAIGKAALDGRSDQYSLAVTLFEALTGKTPFKADTPMGMGLAHINEPPPPLRSVRKELSKELEAVVSIALSKKPAQRYSSIGDFAKALQGNPVPVSPRYKKKVESRQTRRNIGQPAAPTTRLLTKKTTPRLKKELQASEEIESQENSKFVARLAIVVVASFMLILAVNVFVDGSAGRSEEADLVATENAAALEPTAENVQLSIDDLVPISLDTVSLLENVQVVGQGNLTDSDLSPDGGMIVEATAFGLVFRVSDSLEVIETVIMDGDQPSYVTFSPDGSLVAAARGGSINLLDTITYQVLNTLTLTGSSLSDLSFSPDGTRLAVGQYSDAIDIWDTETGSHVQTLERHGDSVKDLAYSPNGEFLASGSFDKSLILWNGSTGDYIYTLPTDSNVVSLAFHPNGNTLVSSSDDGSSILWDLFSASQIGSLPSTPAYQHLAFNADGSMLAGSASNGQVDIWDMTNQEVTFSITTNDYPVSLFFSPDAGRLIFSSENRSIYVLDVLSGEFLTIINGNSPSFRDLAFSPADNALAFGGDDGYVHLWDPLTGDYEGFSQQHTYIVHSLAFSPDGSVLASGSWDDTIILSYPNGGTPVDALTSDSDDIEAIDYSQDGRLIASGSDDGIVRIWDAESHDLLFNLTGHAEWVWALEFHPNSRLIASGGYDNLIRIWDVSNGTQLHLLEGHVDGISAVTYSPDGELLASGGYDGKVILWNSEGELIYVLSDLDNVFSLAFSPDGSLLAVGMYDGTIQLYNVTNSDLVHTIYDETGGASIAFNSDGRLLASGRAGVARIWAIPAN